MMCVSRYLTREHRVYGICLGWPTAAEPAQDCLGFWGLTTMHGMPSTSPRHRERRYIIPQSRAPPCLQFSLRYAHQRRFGNWEKEPTTPATTQRCLTPAHSSLLTWSGRSHVRLFMFGKLGWRLKRRRKQESNNFSRKPKLILGQAQQHRSSEIQPWPSKPHQHPLAQGQLIREPNWGNRANFNTACWICQRQGTRSQLLMVEDRTKC